MGPGFLFERDFWAVRRSERGLDDSVAESGSAGRKGLRSSSRCWTESCLRLKAASSEAERPLVAIAGGDKCASRQVDRDMRA
jgi:hypothetical protein